MDPQLAAVETSFDGDLVDAISAALRAEDAAAHTLPYLMCGGTDAKSFSTPGSAAWVLAAAAARGP